MDFKRVGMDNLTAAVHAPSSTRPSSMQIAADWGQPALYVHSKKWSRPWQLGLVSDWAGLLAAAAAAAVAAASSLLLWTDSSRCCGCMRNGIAVKLPCSFLCPCPGSVQAYFKSSS